MKKITKKKKVVNVLIVDCNEMAKTNEKFSKTGKYFSREIIKEKQKKDKFGLHIGKRYWCLECHLYHLKKDMFNKDVCKECAESMLKDGYHICKCGCETFLWPEDKNEYCYFYRIANGLTKIKKVK